MSGAASAALILLLATLTMLAWPRPAVQARLEPTAVPFVPVPAMKPVGAPVTVPVAASIADTAPAADSAPQIRTHATEKPRIAKARPTVKRAAPPPRKPAAKPSFFKRELLRIVIK